MNMLYISKNFTNFKKKSYKAQSSWTYYNIKRKPKTILKLWKLIDHKPKQYTFSLKSQSFIIIDKRISKHRLQKKPI